MAGPGTVRGKCTYLECGRPGLLSAVDPGWRSPLRWLGPSSYLAPEDSGNACCVRGLLGQWLKARLSAAHSSAHSELRFHCHSHFAGHGGTGVSIGAQSRRLPFRGIEDCLVHCGVNVGYMIVNRVAEPFSAIRMKHLLTWEFAVITVRKAFAGKEQETQ
ncbi:hypothetical protein H8959_006802 [Pygathrix nigripes]